MKIDFTKLILWAILITVTALIFGATYKLPR